MVHRPRTIFKVLSRLVDGDTGERVYVLTGGEEAGLRLAACVDSRTWTTLLTTANLSGMARQVGIDSEEFKQESERALSGQPRATETFFYSVTHTSGGLQLSWKRHLLPDNVKFQLGSVLLREEEAGPTHSMILEHAVSTFLCLQNKISELQRVNLQLAQEQQTALERLEHAIRSKEQVEKEMYSKFKLVLNEKKNKIRRLMDGLVTSAAATALEDEVATTSPAGHSSTPPPPPQSTLLGVPELVSPPTKRRKREARCTETKEPDIAKPPNISCPQTKETNRSKKSDSQQSSSADEDDLLGLL